MKRELKFWTSSILITLLFILFAYAVFFWIAFAAISVLCIYGYYKIKKLFKNDRKIKE